MSIWMISDNCTVDENSIEHNVICRGQSIHLRQQCWSFLIALLEEKKHNGVLSFDRIAEVIWGDHFGWDGERRYSLKEVLREIRRVIGKKTIENIRDVGYRLRYDIIEVLVSHTDKNEYYKKLWQIHHKGTGNDRVATDKAKELIDYFVLSSISTSNGEKVSEPFSEPRFSKLVMAGSGFGKTTFLDMILLCNVVDILFESESSDLSNNTKEKIEEYRKIRKTLFGDSSKQLFPVFINSSKANKCPYSSLLDLAEVNEIENFKNMVDEADRSQSLLFLVDSIDEVEYDKLGAYLDVIKKTLSDYENANVILASRFLGKKVLPFKYDLLHIKELEKDDIEKICFSILSQDEAEKMFERLNKNAYLYSLAKNPFMLMTILETQDNRLLHESLRSIVNAIIDRRWDKNNYEINTEDLMLLLGFLACKFVFENKTDADISIIRQCFINARDNLNRHNVSYNIPLENIGNFLKTLSSQSGILNIVNKEHVEMYVFQDNLIMCWLAANYIYTIILESDEIQEYKGMGGIWANIYWLDNFIRSISQESYLSVSAVNVLVMVLVMISESRGEDLQKSVLYFMFCRDATSLNEQEQLNICKGYRDILNNSFGENGITNSPNSDSFRLILKMLDAHNRQTE